MKKYIEISVIILLLFTIVLSSIYFTLPDYRGQLLAIQYVFLEYIKQNNGAFPQSEVQLISQGFIRKLTSSDGVLYELNLRDRLNPNWHICQNFDEFYFNYGIDFKNIEVIENKLYDKNTKEPILLVNGPHRIKKLFLVVPLRYYESISYIWYNNSLKFTYEP